jgi:hypothetical protein
VFKRALELAGVGALTLWLGGLGPAVAQNAPPVTDLATALQTAAQQQKTVFILYGNDACPNCQVLNYHLTNQDLSLPASDFVYCNLNSNDPASQSAFDAAYSATGPALPRVVIANTNGAQLLARSGYGTVAQYQAFIDQSRVLQPPSNDAFANRPLLSDMPVVIYDAFNSLATKEPGEPNHAGEPGGASLWWEWTAPSNGNYVVSTEGSAFKTVLAVYTGASVLNLIPVVSDTSSGAYGTSRLLLPALAGMAYQIAVDGTHGNAGQVILSIRPAGPPPNDNFANRTVIPGWEALLWDWNIGATKEPGEPNHAGASGGASVWWTWTAPASGAVSLTTDGSSFDTLLAVYTGSSLPALSLVASNDDSGGSYTSALTWNALAGVSYQIAIDGFKGATGMVALLLSAPQPTEFLSLQRLTNQVVRVVLSSPLGQTNVIDASPDLINWTPLSTNVQSTPVIVFDDANAFAQDRRFYRARKWQ